MDTFVQALRTELTESLGNNKIGFSIIHPGLVKTNFHYNRGNVTKEEGEALYDNIAH